MRVLFLAHSFPRTADDSAGSFLLRLAVALREEGIDVHVIAPSAPGLGLSDTLRGIPITRFRYAPRRYETLAYGGTMVETAGGSWAGRFAMVSFLAASVGAALRVQRQIRADVLHAHWWVPGGLAGAAASTLIGTPLVTTMHGTDIRMARKIPAIRPLARAVLGRSAVVTTVSRWLAQESSAMMRGAAPVVAPMPVDTTYCVPGEHRSTDRLLFVGRLNAQKGIAYALRALATMRNAHVVLDVIGDGPDRDRMRALVEELGITHRVVFHGHRTVPEFASLYGQAVALVMPSTDEGLGLVAAEAQLCETPVVGFHSGGLPDVVYHDRTGVLVPHGDVLALSVALDTLVENPARARAMGRAGRAHVLATFSPAVVARRYAGLYRLALDLSRGNPSPTDSSHAA